MAKIDFRLYLITDRHLCSRSGLLPAVEAACSAGIKAVQLREKDLPALALFELAKNLQTLCSRHGARLFINDRLDVAQAAAADGVHLTSDSLPAHVVRTLDAQKLIGVSTHSLDAVRNAEEQGADFVLFGPVFDTPSKRRYGPPMGLQKLHQVCRAAEIPVFAIGGIDAARAKQCLAHGAAGVAVISAILAAADISAAVSGFKSALGKL